MEGRAPAFSGLGFKVPKGQIPEKPNSDSVRAAPHVQSASTGFAEAAFFGLGPKH